MEVVILQYYFKKLINNMSNQKIKAIDAIQEAQKIAFAPFVFQAVVSLRKLGVFDLIFERRKKENSLGCGHK